MKWLLVIVFFQGGEWVTVDGWAPRAQPSYEVCMERAHNVAAYLSENHPNVIAGVYCAES